MHAENVFGGSAATLLGHVQISGTMMATAKQFKTDHPLEPANKFLFHTSIESPDLLNVYTSNVSTGGGKATVELPDYFETLNRDTHTS